MGGILSFLFWLCVRREYKRGFLARCFMAFFQSLPTSTRLIAQYLPIFLDFSPLDEVFNEASMTQLSSFFYL